MSTVKADYLVNAAGTGAPTFTNGAVLSGTPTAPTAAAGTNTTQIATTAFVLANAPATGVQTFTAVGSIAAGSVVVASSTANSVETIGIMTNGQANGSLQTYGSSTGAAGFYSWGRPCPMTSNTFVQARYDNAGARPVSAAVVTVAADGTFTTGTFATAVSASNANYSSRDSVIKISTDKFILFYGTTSTNVLAVVGTISGTTITFGTPVTVYSATSVFVAAATNGADQVLVFAVNSGSPYAGKVIALTVSGTTITVGTSVTFYSSAAYINTQNSDLLAYDVATDRYFIAWSASTAAGSPIYGTVFSISGTTVTAGTNTSLGSELLLSPLTTPTAYYSPTLSVRYVPSIGRMALIIGPTTSNTMSVSTVLISGLSFTRNSTSSNLGSCALPAQYSSNTGELIVLPNSTSAYFVGFAPTTYQPYSVSLGNETPTSGSNIYNALGNGYYINAVQTFPYTNNVIAITNATKAIGLANATVTNGQSLSVAVTGGLCSSLSGLTAGTLYYVTGKGVVTPDSSAVKFIGTAMSTTSMLVGI